MIVYFLCGVMIFLCDFDADQTTGIEQQSHDAQFNVRQARTEASASGPKENRDSGFDFGIAQVPRRISSWEVHATTRLPSWRCRHVAQNCRQEFATSRMAGESWQNIFKSKNEPKPISRSFLLTHEYRRNLIYIYSILRHLCGITEAWEYTRRT